MYIIFSTLVIVLLFIGLMFRKNRELHPPIMSLAFLIDLGLVLVIEFNRKAVETVASSVVNQPDYFLIFHALVSLLVLVLYIMMIFSGLKILKGNDEQIARHRSFAYLFIVLRLTNYITSFFLA